MAHHREYFAHLYLAQEARKHGRFASSTEQPQGTQTVSEGAHSAPTAGSIPAPASPSPPRLGAVAAFSHRAKAGLPPPLERDIQSAILQFLRAHPKVAWIARMNTGGMHRDDDEGRTRYIPFAFVGCSDILGQLKDGRFLAVEVKRPGNGPTPEQTAFLETVCRHNGVGFVARSVDDAQSWLRILG